VPILAPHGINGESARNYHLMDEKSTRERGFHRELPAYLHGFRPVRSKFSENISNGNISRFSNSISYTLIMQTFKKFKYEDHFKMKNKPDLALLETSYLSY
jgi:hypothetical protein